MTQFKQKSIQFISISALVVTSIFALASRSSSLADLWRDANVAFYDSNVWKTTTFLGVPMQQNPCDNQQMQELLFSIKPDIFIEAGTLHGGSALYYATILDQIKPKCKIFTVDVRPMIGEASQYRVWKEHVTSITGRSTDPAIVAQIKKEIFPGAVVFVTLDSDHSRSNVYKELKIYSQLVTPGSYLVLQDTAVNGHPILKSYGPGPMEALDQFLTENHDYKSDRSKEKYFITFYPKGWLQRIK